jgi:hypothetical protein
MRFLSSELSKTNTKNPLPTRFLLMPTFTRGLQFLYTHAYTTLGEGHKPVNCQMSPRSTRFNADLHVSSARRASEGMLSNFLTNFHCISETDRFLLAATSFMNTTISGGRGAREPRGPLLGPWCCGHKVRGCTGCMYGKPPGVIHI